MRYLLSPPTAQQLARTCLWVSPFIIALIGYASSNYSLIGFAVIILTALAMIKLRVLELASFFGTAPFLAITAMLNTPLPLAWNIWFCHWICLFGIGLTSFSVGILFGTGDNTPWNRFWNVTWPIIIGLLGAAINYWFFALPSAAFHIFIASVIFHAVAYFNHRRLTSYSL